MELLWPLIFNVAIFIAALVFQWSIFFDFSFLITEFSNTFFGGDAFLFECLVSSDCKLSLMGGFRSFHLGDGLWWGFRGGLYQSQIHVHNLPLYHEGPC